MFEVIDRREKMFGRKRDASFLIERVKNKGLTAVVGRPKMGKTWLLQETVRQLVENGYLVGYHECLGEGDQLLRTVADLYSRWLSNSSMAQQAKSLWVRHKGSWLTKSADAVGAIISAASEAPVVGKVFAGLVEKTFQGLAKADEDMNFGGLSIKPLPYEIARDLVCILATIAQKRVILVFDAWEQSISLDSDRKTLDSFLAHLNEWPASHLILGIRHPAVGDETSDRGMTAVRNVVRAAPGIAEIFELLPLSLDDPIERHNLCALIRTRVRAAGEVNDDDLIAMLKGYPGVLDLWMTDYHCETMNNSRDLLRLAEQAQHLRYVEFDSLIPKLSSAERIVALRLAILYRFDASSWEQLKNIVLKGVLKRFSMGYMFYV